MGTDRTQDRPLNNVKEKLEQLDMNAFRYIVDDNMLHCLYQKIGNEAEKNYYNHRRKNKFNNFVINNRLFA